MVTRMLFLALISIAFAGCASQPPYEPEPEPEPPLDAAHHPSGAYDPSPADEPVDTGGGKALRRSEW